MEPKKMWGKVVNGLIKAMCENIAYRRGLDWETVAMSFVEQQESK